MENLTTWGAAIRGKGVEFVEFFSQTPLQQINGWEPVVKITRSNDATSSFSGKTGAGFLQRFADGAMIPTLNRFKLFDTSVDQEQVGGRIPITRQTLLYRDFGDVFDENGDLIQAVKTYISRAGAQIFNRAFTSGTGVTNGTRVASYGDGVALASVSHPRSDGGTAQSNASATGIPLTETNIETGRVALLNQASDDGVALVAPGEIYVVVGINNDKTAQIITKSDQRSGTTNNDINIYGGGYIKVMSSSWLDTAFGGTNNTQWFLVAPAWSKLTIVLSAGPDLEVLIDQSTKAKLFDVILDIGICYYDWRGVFCSLGDNLAYAG